MSAWKFLPYSFIWILRNNKIFFTFGYRANRFPFSYICIAVDCNSRFLIVKIQSGNYFNEIVSTSTGFSVHLYLFCYKIKGNGKCLHLSYTIINFIWQLKVLQEMVFSHIYKWVVFLYILHVYKTML